MSPYILTYYVHNQARNYKGNDSILLSRENVGFKF